MGFFCTLSELSLDDLVAAAQANSADDTEEMAEILRRFDGAVWSVARSYTADADLRNDAAQAARLGLVKAVRAHKLGTAGFTTYAWRYMKGEALRTIKSMQIQETVVDPTAYAWPDQPPRDAAPNTNFEVLDLMAALTPEQQTIAEAHYIGDVSFKDIAAQLGISRPAVTQRFTIIHRNLRTVVEGALAA
jgi:RNA polymerase sigma factor (sigma-70 family)